MAGLRREQASRVFIWEEDDSDCPRTSQTLAGPCLFGALVTAHIKNTSEQPWDNVPGAYVPGCRNATI